jgi:hypothetical protein
LAKIAENCDQNVEPLVTLEPALVRSLESLLMKPWQPFSKMDRGQGDQIARIFAIWVILGSTYYDNYVQKKSKSFGRFFPR